MSDVKVYNCHNNSTFFNTSDWVKHADHLSAMKSLTKANEALREDNETLIARLADREKELEDEIAGWKAAAESTYFDNLAMLEELGE